MSGAYVIMFCPPDEGVRAGTGAGGFSVVRLTEQFLSDLTQEEREELAPRALTKPEAERRVREDRTHPYAVHVTSPGLEGLREGLQRRLEARRKKAVEEAARLQEARDVARAWIEAGQLDQHDRGPLLDLRRELLRKGDPALYERYMVVLQGRINRLHCERAVVWLEGLAPEHQGLPEVQDLRRIIAEGGDPGEIDRRLRPRWGAVNKAHEAVVAAKRAAEAEQEAAERAVYEAERAAWVAAHGSAHLRAVAAEAIEHDGLYRDERFAAERPGWARARELVDKDPGVRDPRNPPPEALDLLRQARKTDPEARLVWAQLEGWEIETWRGYLVQGAWMGENVWFGVPDELLRLP